jgi:hypothetical protein
MLFALAADDGRMDLSATGITTSIVMVCAVLASLAAGVLLAYGLCATMFGVFRMHAEQVRATKLSGSVVGVLEG